MGRPRVDAFIALGSNAGDRRAHIEGALRDLRDLPESRLLRASPVIETAPVGGAPGQRAYLNAAVMVETRLAVRALFGRLMEIEAAHGRDRSRETRWGARTLDLDLLMYDALVLDCADLVVPHPRMHERGFVLGPMASIAPWARHARTGVSVAGMLAGL